MPSQRQWKLQDPRLHEMATERQALQAEASGMQQQRVKLPKTTAGCASSLPPASRLRFPRGAAEALRRVLLFSWEASSLPKQGHLLEEILLTGFLALSCGTRCPLGVPWSSALSVMPERFPAERAP